MLKSLTKVGNSHAILLDKVIMDILGIDADSRAEKKFDKLLTRIK